MIKYITLFSALIPFTSAFSNGDSTLTPFDAISEQSITKFVDSKGDTGDYIMPISVNQKSAYFTKINTIKSGRDAQVKMVPYAIEISESLSNASNENRPPYWSSNATKTIIGASQNNDTIYVMGSKDERLNFQQGLLRIHKESVGWSEPEKLKIKWFKPTSWNYGMSMHSSGDILLIYQKSVITDDFELFVSFREEPAVYGKPVKLESICTTGDEITPYLSEDKKRLYFASNGHSNPDSSAVQNYDLFVSQVMSDDFSSLSKPERLPEHINLGKSFEAYISEIDSNHVIFSSDREGKGMRLYAAKITRGYIKPEPIIEEVIVPEPEPVIVEEVIPEPIPKEPKKIVLSSEELNFGSNQANVSPEAIAQLKTNFPFTPETDASTQTITVTGYSDSMGSESYNVTLSKKRADAMKKALVELGWSPDKIVTVGKGEANPIADNKTPEGRAKNRRVEFLVR
jgi:outer membrane protein OmpA-like peptidoglycan-associated protein